MGPDDASTVLACAFSLLVIDPQADDARRVSEMFRVRRGNVFCDHVENGGHACDYLRRTGEFEHVGRPNLILLNLGMSSHSGQDFLTIRQGVPEWHEIPVIAFTSSNSEGGRQACLHNGADMYVVKPADWEEWRVMLSAIINVYARRRLI